MGGDFVRGGVCGIGGAVIYTFGSICSGIEAASVAFEPLGWKPQWYSEIEKFPSAVLAHHYPTVPNLGDMTRIIQNETFKKRPVDVLCGGTPCQDFSIAGKRAGLDAPRGNLALVFLKIIAVARPRWFIWENVPGVLSNNEGRDLGTFLYEVGKIGYGWAYRVLDAQYFGVPQSRNRIFVVGYLGDWQRPASVLFEQESLSGNSKPGRKGRERNPGTVENSVTADSEVTSPLASLSDLECEGGGKGYLGKEDTAFTVATHQDQSVFIPYKISPSGISPTIDTGCQDGPIRNQGGMVVFRQQAFGKYASTASTASTVKSRDYKDATDLIVYENHAQDKRIKEVNVAPNITAKAGTGGGNLPLVLTFEPGLLQRKGGHVYENKSGCIRRQPGDNQMTVCYGSTVRKFTPLEVERLMGFPDGYTNIPWQSRGRAVAEPWQNVRTVTDTKRSVTHGPYLWLSGLGNA